MKSFLRNFLHFWFLLMVLCATSLAYGEPLPSWNNGDIKQSIINFVNAVTDKSSPDYVAPADRIAVFDNDGTLWVEQPVYTEVIFSLARVHELAAQHPDWQTQEPFKTFLGNNMQALTQLSAKDYGRLVAVTHAGMSVEDFIHEVQTWLAMATNARFKHLYTELVYQPMLETIDYLRQNNFTIYIVTGGGQEFVRAFADKVYGIPVERIIGSSSKSQYTDKNNQPQLIKMPDMLLITNFEGKPEGINLFVGKKPIIAFGNSDGDRQMLEWTQSSNGKHLMLLVHHDDAQREYAYGPNTKIGTFSDSLMTEAKQQGWKIISMKQDWKKIFPFSQTNAPKQP